MSTGPGGQDGGSGPIVQESRLGQFSWLLYECANQPYFTLITVFIFANYFATVVVGDAVEGQALWGYTQAAAGVVIALMSPILGAMADANGARKPWIAPFMLICALACIYLWEAVPGGALLPIAIAVVAASVGAEFTTTFCNAMLPSIVSERRMGFLSGMGMGVSQASGVVALGIMLVAFQLPDEPFFGLDKAAHEHDRIVGPFAGIWFIIFMIPLFLFTPDLPSTGRAPLESARHGIHTFGKTLARLGHFRNIAIFLLGRMLYADGLSAVFIFGGIIAGGLFGWGTMELAIFGIVVIFFSSIGGFAGSWIDHHFGSRLTILFFLGVVMVAVTGMLSLDGDTVFFFFDVEPRAEGAATFSSLPEQLFLAVTIVFGFAIAPILASSRAMVGRLAPHEMMTEFFGLYALAGKATSFAAPLTIGLVTQMTGDQRIGLSVVLIFIAAGFVAVLQVREERSTAIH